MSNLSPETKKIFDELIKNNAYDNILQMYDNCTYHIELCMIPKDKMQEYETELSANGPFSSGLKKLINKNKVIIADTSGCPRFNITSAKMKTYTQSGSIRTTDKSNVHINGRMVETVLTIQEVYGFTLMNKLDFMCAMLGYQSRHLTPMFLNIWFSGVENWKDGTSTTQNNGQYMKIKDCIGEVQYIYRGVLTDVKTTTSTSTETIYEAKFSSDNYSTDDKCFEACFSFSKAISVKSNTQNFLGDVAIQLEHQINENFLLSQPTAVAKHIYDSNEHKPITFKIYDNDKKKIYDGSVSKTSIDYYDISKLKYEENYGVRIASLYQDQLDRYKSSLKDVEKLLEKHREVIYSGGIPYYTNNYKDNEETRSLLATKKQLEEDIERANRNRNESKSEKQSIRKSSRESSSEIQNNIDTRNAYAEIYGVEPFSTSINNAITKNIKNNPLISKDNEEIKISCDGSSLDNIFNNILISYIDTVSNKELGGIGACCNIVPHFLAEYEGKCYYNYDIEISLVKVPGLEEVVEQQKTYLEKLTGDKTENVMDFPMMQYGFLMDLKNKKIPLKSYKYMYSGSDISVLDYNTDMSQLYLMDTGVSLYKNILFNKMNKDTQVTDGISYTEKIVASEKDAHDNKPNTIKFLPEIDKLIAERSNGHIYMEDLWNAIMIEPSNGKEQQTQSNNLKIAQDILSQNFNAIALGTTPITDNNDISDGVLSLKKIAWNNIFNVACQNATIKIVGDPFWIAPNIPFSYNSPKNNEQTSLDQINYMTFETQTFPVLLFSYVPFVEQQPDDTFKINEAYSYQIPYMVTEVNSLFEEGQFTQELVCVLQPEFTTNTSLISLSKKEVKGGSVAVFFGNEKTGREAVMGENGEIFTRNATR